MILPEEAQKPDILVYLEGHWKGSTFMLDGGGKIAATKAGQAGSERR